MPPTGTDEGLRAADQIAVDDPGVGVLILSEYLEPAKETVTAKTRALQA